VSKEVYDSKQLPDVPERRPIEKQARSYEAAAEKGETQVAPATEALRGETPEGPPKARLWYCKQCGYVVYRDEPPYVCPICKAKKEMFAELNARIDFLG
jgi:rubrerythrin